MSVLKFKFWDYVKSDLVRAAILGLAAVDQPKGWQLWLGIFSPRFTPVLLCRAAYFLNQHRLGSLAKLVSLLNFVTFGIEISLQCEIGKGFYLPHTQGTVIGAISIGENVIVFQGVTLGAKELDIGYNVKYRPIIGSNVVVGAGAKILGGIEIGDNSKVGANAVVLENVPSDVLVVGIPAWIVKKKVIM